MFNCLNIGIVLIFNKNFNKWLCRWFLRAKIFIYSLSGFIKSLNKHCYRNPYNSLIKVNKPIFLESKTIANYNFVRIKKAYQQTF